RGGQLILSTTPPAGVVDMLGVAGGGETGDPDIDAGLAAGGRRDGGHVITGKLQHPISPLAFDLDRFTRPCTARCTWTLTWPMPCRYTRGCRVASGRRRRLWATPHCRIGPCP